MCLVGAVGRGQIFQLIHDAPGLGFNPAVMQSRNVGFGCPFSDRSAASFHTAFGHSQVSFTITEKTTTAIVGPSGAGKTTMCNLIARFLDVNAGKITIGGTDGFLYLTAIIDWYSRCIVGWDVDDTLDTTMVINACKKAFKVAKPLIVNSDQGSQFTSDKYIAFIRDNGIRQSMDGKSRWADNIMIERCHPAIDNKRPAKMYYQAMLLDEARVAA